MPVYVDDVELPFRGMQMCHLWADTLEELFEMVAKIGLSRRWIQGHRELSLGKAKNASWIHFDVCKSKKKAAVKAGAILTDRYGPVLFTANRDLILAAERGDLQWAIRAHAVLVRCLKAREQANVDPPS